MQTLKIFFIYSFILHVCLPARVWHMRAEMTADAHNHSRWYSKTASVQTAADACQRFISGDSTAAC